MYTFDLDPYLNVTASNGNARLIGSPGQHWRRAHGYTVRGLGTAAAPHVEAMADEFEQQSGQPETEIRGKIAMLRSVLGARPAAVASQCTVYMCARRCVDSIDQTQGPESVPRFYRLNTN